MTAEGHLPIVFYHPKKNRALSHTSTLFLAHWPQSSSYSQFNRSAPQSVGMVTLDEGSNLQPVECRHYKSQRVDLWSPTIFSCFVEVRMTASGMAEPRSWLGRAQLLWPEASTLSLLLCKENLKMRQNNINLTACFMPQRIHAETRLEVDDWRWSQSLMASA